MPPRIAVLGLGEAGSEIAADLVAAGADVQGFDPVATAPHGVQACPSDHAAVVGAELVLSVNSAADALPALRDAATRLEPGAVWADLNSGSVALKRRLAATLAEHHGESFADVVLMASVPGKGLRSPMLASGPGAERVRALLQPLGADIDVVGPEPGDAAARKLLRSVFYKGLAAAVVEATTAARAVGLEDWLRENIGAELASADTSTVELLVSGSRKHAARRAEEMADAVELLQELGVEPRVARASRDLLRGLAPGAD